MLAPAIRIRQALLCGILQAYWPATAPLLTIPRMEAEAAAELAQMMARIRPRDQSPLGVFPSNGIRDSCEANRAGCHGVRMRIMTIRLIGTQRVRFSNSA